MRHTFRQTMLGSSGNPKIATFDRRGGVEETYIFDVGYYKKIVYVHPVHIARPGKINEITQMRVIFLPRIQMIQNF